MTEDFKANLSNHLVTMKTKRETSAEARWSRLTPQEQLLVKEAVVMGFFLGRTTPTMPYPKDSEVLMDALITVNSYPDLYPTLAEYDTEDGEEN